MGIVVNRSLKQVQKSIARKADKLKAFIEDNAMTKCGKWSLKRSKLYNKLLGLAESLSEEISYLDEIEIPNEDD